MPLKYMAKLVKLQLELVNSRGMCETLLDGREEGEGGVRVRGEKQTEQ